MKKYRYIFLAAIPFIVLCVFLVCTTSNLPENDQWDFVPLLEKWYTGSLTLLDLWRQHNEHRVFFPILFSLAVAALTRWNLYWGVAVNLILGTGICAVLFYQIRKMERFFNFRAGIIYFLVSVFVFSVAQSENWFLGGMGMFLNILSFAAGIIFLSSPAFGLKKFLCAVTAGVITTFSFANGVLFWIIGFFLLCLRPLERKKETLVSWTLISAFMAAAYLWGYQKPPNHPSLFFAALHPLQAAGYFFVFLGSSLLPFTRFAAISGFMGLVCLALSVLAGYHAYMFTRKNPAALLTVLPWFALAAYGVASAAMSMVGRAGFGVAQATASRYTTVSNLLWISLIALAPVAAQSAAQRGSGFLPDIARNRVLRYSCLAVFLAMHITVTRQRWFWEQVRKDEMTRAGDALLAGQYDEELIRARVYKPGNIRDRIAILKKYRLALFRDK